MERNGIYLRAAFGYSIIRQHPSPAGRKTKFFLPAGILLAAHCRERHFAAKLQNRRSFPQARRELPSVERGEPWESVCKFAEGRQSHLPSFRLPFLCKGEVARRSRDGGVCGRKKSFHFSSCCFPLWKEGSLWRVCLRLRKKETLQKDNRAMTGHTEKEDRGPRRFPERRLPSWDVPRKIIASSAALSSARTTAPAVRIARSTASALARTRPIRRWISAPIAFLLKRNNGFSTKRTTQNRVLSGSFLLRILGKCVILLLLMV